MRLPGLAIAQRSNGWRFSLEVRGSGHHYISIIR